MSVEMHIQTSRIRQMVALGARRALRTTCLPEASALVHLDHIEIVDAEIEIVGAGNTVRIRIPADVFVVTQAALLAAPNGIPDGAQSPNRITLIYELRAEVRAPVPPNTTRHPVFRFVAQDPDLGALDGALGPAAGPTKNAIRTAMALPEMNLTDTFQSLRLPMPRAGDAALAGDVVTIRFDPDASPPVSRLSGVQQWGLFLPGSAWEELARANIQPSLGSQLLRIVRVEANWRPNGSMPHVDLRLIIEATVEIEHPLGTEHLDLTGWISIACDFERVPVQAGAHLRLTASWSVHLSTPVGGLIEGLVEDVLEDMVADELKPEKFGAVPAGDRTFILDRALPSLNFAAATLRPDSLIAMPAGATLGGLVSVRGLWEPEFVIDESRLSGPMRIQLCSALAKIGSGQPSKEPLSIANAKSNGMIAISGMGRLCGFQVISPAGFPASLLRLVPGNDSEHVEIRVTIPYAQALAMQGPLRILVKTPRGVRLVDLGHAPQVTVDAHGKITNGIDLFIPDCLHFHGHLLGWGLDGRHHLEKVDFKPPPFEHPDWLSFIQAGHGLSVQLVTLKGLDAGEIVRFRSPTHAMDVSADANGVVVLPVFVTHESVVAPARLERVNRRSLRGHVDVDTAAFQHQASVAHGSARTRFSITRNGSALLTSVSKHRTVTDAVRPDGTRLRISASHDEVALNPQPLPPEPPPEVTALGLGELSAVIPIAGSDGTSTMVAVRTDGSKVLLNRTADGDLRVAGTFDGPVGSLQRQGEWALATGDEATVLLRIMRDG